MKTLLRKSMMSGGVRTVMCTPRDLRMPDDSQYMGFYCRFSRRTDDTRVEEPVGEC
jgi:hypothetical protein